MSRISIHVPPVKADIDSNREKEPEGEKIRRELIDFIERNKIVSMMLDTDEHCISFDIVKLPPNIKPVLTRWGSIYVRDDDPPTEYDWRRYWRQPPLDRILMDGTHALMNMATFEALQEYSASKPTGVFEGKMWRRHDGVFDQEFIASGGKPVWMLCWYGPSDKPDHVSNNHRKILLSDGELPA